MIRGAIIAVAFISSHSAIVHAQAVEDTVAFIVMGLEDGHAVGGTKFKQTGGGRFEAQESDGKTWAVGIRQVSPCVFEANFSQVGVPINSYNFNTGWYADIADNNGVIKGKSIHCLRRGGEQICHDFIFLRSLIDSKRWLRASEHLKAAFCKGRAF